MEKIKEAYKASGTGLRGSGRIGSLVKPPSHGQFSDMDLAPKVTIEFAEPGEYYVILEGDQRRPATLRCGELHPYSIDDMNEYKTTEYLNGKTVHIFRGALKRGSSVRDGPGSFHYGSGEVFEGRWKNNLRYGLGGLYLPSGYSYEGMFKDDLPNGRGVETFPFGEKYVGLFSNGKPHGKGTLYYLENGCRFEGEWIQGEKQGEGSIFYDNGDVFHGTWQNGKREGHGYTFYASTQKCYKSTWSRDQCGKKMIMIPAKDAPEIRHPTDPPLVEVISPLSIDLRSFRVVADLWTEVHPAHFSRIKHSFEALDSAVTGEIEMSFLRSIWDPNNLDTLTTLERAATTVGADDTLELIEVLTGLYPHLPSSETKRWVLVDLPLEYLLRIRGCLSDVNSTKNDGFYVLTGGKPELTQQQVQDHKSYVGGVKVSRAMFMRNRILHGCETMTFPQLLGQLFPNMWKESLLRLEMEDIPEYALNGYAAAFDAFDDGNCGYMSLEKMKTAQRRFQTALANGLDAISMPTSAFESKASRSIFKHQARWLVGDISITIGLMRTIDRSRTGFVSLAELLRFSFPNVACTFTRERLGSTVRSDDFCKCCICVFCQSSTAYTKPRPPSPYTQNSGDTW